MVSRVKEGDRARSGKPAKKLAKKPPTSSNTSVIAGKKRKNEDNDQFEDLGNIDSWNWSEVNVADSTIFSEEGGGFMCLEEIDDVMIDHVDQQTGGKTLKFKQKVNKSRTKGKKAMPDVPMAVEEMEEYYDIDDFDEKLVAHESTSGKKIKPQNDSDEDEADQVPQNNKNATKDGKKNKDKAGLDNRKAQEQQVSPEKVTKDKEEAGKKNPRPSINDVDKAFDISAWNEFKLAKPIQLALKYNAFSSPTQIQQRALPLALSGKDVIGVAETGSGKTLAFGIPMIQYILKHASSANSGTLAGLVLVPTRELAIQVKDHIQNIALFTDIKVIAIVGGMSPQKQLREMRKQPNIIVATPGRFWDLFSDNNNYMALLQTIRFLVIDEADRMIEKGHYEEVTNILNKLSTKRLDTSDWPEEAKDGQKPIPKKAQRRQTFVYTATLSQYVRLNITKKNKKTSKDNSKKDTLDQLLEKVEFSDKEPTLVDMTTDNFVASGLVESKVNCLHTDKDVYLYYFLTRYPGRTIVFTNSITAIRRLVPVLTLLNIEVHGLHAQMPQRQRLKNLDRFKANSKAVLISSDVAARGLDIPLVDHVIHYQIPRSGEIYVHRSGRTARANRDGMSLLLCDPEDSSAYRKLCQSLRNGKDYDEFPIEMSIWASLKAHIDLAVEIDSLEHQDKKAQHDDSWILKMAKEMDIEVDDDMIDKKPAKKSNVNKQAKAEAYALKAELKQLLRTPVLPVGTSQKYLTSTIDLEAIDRLVSQSAYSLLPGHNNERAIDNIKQKSKKRKTK